MSYLYDPYVYTGLSGMFGAAVNYGYTSYYSSSSRPGRRPPPYAPFGPIEDPENNPFLLPQKMETPLSAARTLLENQENSKADRSASGISFKHKTIHCKPTIKQWHKPKSVFATQYSMVLNKSSGYTGSTTSGTQINNILGTFPVVSDFCRFSQIAATASAFGKNLFVLNPNQITTGSGYATSVPADALVTSANPVTPGAVFTAYNYPTVPIQDWVNVHKWRMTIELTNLMNEMCSGYVYVAKAVRDMNSETVLTTWTYADQAFNSGASETTFPSTANVTLPSQLMVHSVPGGSQNFRSNWKIVAAIPCAMGQGSTCKVNITFSMNREYSRLSMQKKNADGLTIPTGSFQVFSSFHGMPVRNSDGVAPNCVFSEVGIACIVTNHVSLSWPVKFGRQSSAYAWTDQKELIETKQVFTDVAGAQTSAKGA